MSRVEVGLDNLSITSLKDKNMSMSKGQYKTSPLKVKQSADVPILRKPKWIKAKLPTANKIQQVSSIKNILRENNLHSVCEEASCPNLPECFSKGTATFMIMGDICTRRCPFCDVQYGRPRDLDTQEPQHLADTIAKLNLSYVVITSVDRDDLRDGGALHFVECLKAIRAKSNIKLEILTPDFKNKINEALEILGEELSDVFNHNLETAKSLYPKARPQADYEGSLYLLKQHKALYPQVPTKSGIMLGLGETDSDIRQTMTDLRNSDVNMLTLGQYLQPSLYHLKVEKYYSPEEFKKFELLGKKMGFAHVAAGPMVRSSYHADEQAKEIV